MMRTLVGMWILVSPLWAYLDLVTGTGEIWRTTDGSTWNRLAQVGSPHPAGYVAGNPSFLLTRDGILHMSSDQGATWVVRKHYAFSDGVALIHDPGNGKFLALTRSGLVYRGDSATGLTPVGRVPASDCVDLVVKGGLPSLLFALTASGDVFRSSDLGATWQLVGNTGTPSAQAMTVRQDTLLVLTYAGDVFRSVDTGKTWTGWKVLSQVGAVDLHDDGAGGLFAVLETGELAMYDRNAGTWTWLSTPSQMGVVLLTTGGVVTFEDESASPSQPAWQIRLLPEGRVLLTGLPEGQRFRVVDGLGRVVMKGRTRVALLLSLPSPGVFFFRLKDRAMPLVGIR